MLLSIVIATPNVIWHFTHVLLLMMYMSGREGKYSGALVISQAFHPMIIPVYTLKCLMAHINLAVLSINLAVLSINLAVLIY